jgi:hypothetical protein
MVEIFNEGAEEYAEDIAIQSLIGTYIHLYGSICFVILT